jgi:phage protein D
VFGANYSIEVGGRLLSEDLKRLITSIEVLASIDGADELKITATAWDSVDQRFRFMGETLIGPGSVVIVRVGYGQDLEALQRFRMVREEVRYGADGVPVTLRGYSAEVRLVDNERARSWPAGTTVAEIVRDMARAADLRVTSDSLQGANVSASRAARVKGKGVSDWQHLQGLAEELGHGPPLVRYSERLKADVLYFRPLSLATQGEIARFVMMPNLTREGAPATCFEFSPSLSLAGVPTGVEVTGWDRIAQRPIRVRVSLEGGRQQTTVRLGDRSEPIAEGIRSGSQLEVVLLESGGVPQTRKDEVISTTIDSLEGAREYASRWLATRNAAFLTASATVVGFERLWVGQIHRFEGLAAHHAGLYEVQECGHRVDAGGYFCRLELARVVESAGAAVETL